MRIFSAILAFGLALSAQTHASALIPQHWYLPGKPGQWCSYPSELAWQKASDAALMSDSASAYVSGNTVQSLRIFRSDQSGEWALTDDYALKDSQVLGLTRTFNSFEKGRVVDDFVLKDGKLVRTSRRYFTMYDQPMTPKKGVDYDAHAPIYARLDAMPFYPVVFDKPGTGTICKSANRDKPARPKA